MPRTNVVFFGNTGSGKSCLINMIAGSNAAATSSGAKGCTFRTNPYHTTIRGREFTFHDTCGFNEGAQSRTFEDKAIIELYRLLKHLIDGVSLLVYVMKAPARIEGNTTTNWKLFNDVLCKRDVPITIVITGLELEDDMNEWWTKNKQHFKDAWMNPFNHACVTTVKGKEKRGFYQFQEEYDQSKRTVEDMIFQSLRPTPWKMDTIDWLDHMIYQTTMESRKWGAPIERQLIDRCGMSRDDAEKLVKELDAV
ncbi:P-loop containing nucleoside triphosphate hydrolase protein [Crepidotus variabilis]|uniref:P-loop containing nucleoside triphosphate hydrolase protein n=1 Tax=Crepidotus variabilis TaxID=179855 RepID=A0A9P6E9C7_9AGAR|nr:P-loop containing nucleoside triphosphate hydrolase protein [Crepidotus variabilis]